MPISFQSAFSCPILSPQTKTETEEVKRISHTGWVFWLSAHEASDGHPRAQTLLSPCLADGLSSSQSQAVPQAGLGGRVQHGETPTGVQMSHTIAQAQNWLITRS